MSNKLNMVKCQWPDIKLQTALALLGWVGWAKWNLKLWNIIHPPFLLSNYASLFSPWRLEAGYGNRICVSSKYADSYSNLSLVILWFLKKRRRSWEKGRQHSHFWTSFEADLTHTEPQIRLKAVPPYIPFRTNLSYHDGVEAGGIWLLRWISLLRVSVWGKGEGCLLPEILDKSSLVLCITISSIYWKHVKCQVYC